MKRFLKLYLRSNGRWVLHIAIPLVAIATAGGPALGAPVYHVLVSGGQGTDEASAALDVSRGSMASGGGNEINAFAAAGHGALHADTNTRFLQLNPDGAGGRLTASANAYMTLDDVIITGPAGPISTKYKV